MDELRGVWVQEEGRNFFEEGIPLDVAMGAEAGGDFIEAGVVVAGMAAEFKGSGGVRWQGLENFAESAGVEVASGRDADRAVGGEDAVAAKLRLVFKLSVKVAEQFYLNVAEAVAVTESETPGLLEWVANGVDAGPLGYAEERTGDGGEEMGVFVGVEVGDANSSALEFRDLGEGFALDLFSADAVAEVFQARHGSGSPENSPFPHLSGGGLGGGA